jgi:hypothetical protein
MVYMAGRRRDAELTSHFPTIDPRGKSRRNDHTPEFELKIQTTVWCHVNYCYKNINKELELKK